MSKNKEIAQAVLELVGGKDNVTQALHCMTRLRLRIKDTQSVDLDRIKEVGGVYGAQFAEDSLQVVIGPTVDEVYQEFLDLTGLEASPLVEETLDSDAPVAQAPVTHLLNTIFNTFSSCMTPIIPLFVAMGMVNVISILIGPTMLNLVSAESNIYTNFYYIGQAIVYFLPVFVAITASKQFKCSVMISVTLVGLMLYPDIIAALALEGGYTIFGLPAPNVAYSAQLIPAMLVVFVQSYVERMLKKIIPNAVRVIGVPLGTLLIMLPLAFCVLGPAGYYAGTALTSAILWLYSVAGPVATAILGALSLFMLGLGISRPLFFAVLGMFMTNGVDFVYMGISMVLGNWVVCGISAAYAIKAKSAEQKQMGITGFVANILGGVSEPIVFGIILPNRKTYLPVLISGGLSGLFMGIMKVGYYQFGPANFLSVIGFIGGDANNFIFGCIASAIAFITAFVSMLLLYNDTPIGRLKNPVRAK